MLPGDTGDIGSSDLNFANLKNGGYAVSWGLNTGVWGDFYIENAAYQSPIIYGLNQSGDIEWESPIILQSPILLANIYDIFTTSNGDIVGCGEVLNTRFDSTDAYCGLVVRLSPEGELKWVKTICDEYASYKPIWQTYLWDGAELPNGDLIFTGHTADSTGRSDFPYFYPQHDIWLLRLDSDGCLISDCEWDNDYILADATPIKIKEKPFDFVMKPNPATQLTTLAFDQPITENTYLRLLTIDGKVLLERKLPKGQMSCPLPLLGIPNGLYFVQLQLGGKQVIVKKLVIE